MHQNPGALLHYRTKASHNPENCHWKFINFRMSYLFTFPEEQGYMQSTISLTESRVDVAVKFNETTKQVYNKASTSLANFVKASMTIDKCFDGKT